MIIAGLCLIPALVAGAKSDVKDRTFPATYWDYPSKAGGVVTFICYLYMIAVGMGVLVGGYLAISVVFALGFYAMGLRFGSGGDWRALMYIAAICPLLIVQTVIFSLIAGAVIAAVMMFTYKEDELDPLAFRSVPFAVAIFIGLLAAMAHAAAYLM
jgi:hypothetical protein